MKTIDYYNQYADEFAQATLNVDMESLYQPFLAELPERARILDVGCGSGRDTLAFLNKGSVHDKFHRTLVLSGFFFQNLTDLSEKVSTQVILTTKLITRILV